MPEARTTVTLGSGNGDSPGGVDCQQASSVTDKSATVVDKVRGMNQPSQEVHRVNRTATVRTRFESMKRYTKLGFAGAHTDSNQRLMYTSA